MNFRSLLVLGSVGLLAACASAPQAPHATIVSVARTEGGNLRQRLQSEHLQGFVVMANKQVLYATKAAATAGGPGQKSSSESGSSNFRIIADHGDVIEVETVGTDPGSSCRFGVSLGHRDYALRVFVPRSALEPVVRSTIVEQHDDETGLIVESGAPVRLDESSASVAYEPALDAVGFQLPDSAVSLAFAWSATEKAPALEPLTGTVACSERGVITEPVSMFPEPRKPVDSFERSERGAKDPPPRKRPASSTMLTPTPLSDVDLKMFGGTTKASTEGVLSNSQVPSSLERFSQNAQANRARPCLLIGDSKAVAFAGKPLAGHIIVDESLQRLDLKRANRGPGYLATSDGSCSHVRVRAGASALRADRRGGAGVGGLGGLGGRAGLAAHVQQKYSTWSAKAGSPVTWPDGSAAGKLRTEATFFDVEERGDRLCFTIDRLHQKICHAKKDVLIEEHVR